MCSQYFSTSSNINITKANVGCIVVQAYQVWTRMRRAQPVGGAGAKRRFIIPPSKQRREYPNQPLLSSTFSDPVLLEMAEREAYDVPVVNVRSIKAGSGFQVRGRGSRLGLISFGIDSRSVLPLSNGMLDRRSSGQGGNGWCAPLECPRMSRLPETELVEDHRARE